MNEIIDLLGPVQNYETLLDYNGDDFDGDWPSQINSISEVDILLPQALVQHIEKIEKCIHQDRFASDVFIDL